MAINKEDYSNILAELAPKNVTLVAVSKTKPPEDIQALYDLGQRDFGENYVQELLEKQAKLPPDIRWHFIGHLQSNKVKFLAPFVHLIHGVDSAKLLSEIDKQGRRCGRVIDCLLQVHIAREETKFGFDAAELRGFLFSYSASTMPHLRIRGLMGMASFSDNLDLVRSEFRQLKTLFDHAATNPALGGQDFTILSMGMSGDYRIAVEEGTSLVRIGSLVFGARA